MSPVRRGEGYVRKNLDERKGLSIIVHIHSPPRLNSVARVRGCSMDHVRYAHINAQAPRSPRFESGRRDFFIKSLNKIYMALITCECVMSMDYGKIIYGKIIYGK